MNTPQPSELLEGIRKWVEIESQTADTDGVNQVMSVVADGYAQAGAKVDRIPGRDGFADHLSISTPWGGDEPGILVLCHLDTVHPRGTLETLPFRVEDDKAFGPGIYDMKGGAYLAYAAFRTLAEAGRTTPLPIRFLYLSDEEVGSPTSRSLIEAAGEGAKYVLVTEPARNGGKVVTGRKGTSRYVISTEGKPAHSGSQHQAGRSAIREMAHQIVALEALTDYDRGLTFNVGCIEGGTTPNTIPQHCQVELDVRMTKIEDADEAHRIVTGLKPVDPDVSLTVTGQLNRPPYEKTPEIAALLETAQGLAAEIGFELVDTYTGGGSDGSFLATKVPTLDGLGVDGSGAHTLNEHLYVSSLVPRMTLQRRLFETLQ